FVIQVQILHQGFVVRDESGVAVQDLALSAGLGGNEHRGVLVQVLPVRDVRVLLCHPWWYVPADVSFVAGGAGVYSHLLIRNVLLGEVSMPPVFHDDVHLAGGKPLPRNLFVQVLLHHSATKLVFRDVAVHGGIGRIADPGVHRDTDSSAGRIPGTCGGGGHLVHGSTPAACQQQGSGGDSCHQGDSSLQQRWDFFHLLGLLVGGGSMAGWIFLLGV